MQRGIVGQQAVGWVVGVGVAQAIVGDSDRQTAKCDHAPGVRGWGLAAGIRGRNPWAPAAGPRFPTTFHRLAPAGSRSKRRPARAPGTGTALRMSLITVGAVTLRMRAAGLMISRWPNTGSASALMSSGMT